MKQLISRLMIINGGERQMGQSLSKIVKYIIFVCNMTGQQSYTNRSHPFSK